MFLPELHCGTPFLGPVQERGASDCTIFDTYVTFFNPGQLFLVEFLFLLFISYDQNKIFKQNKIYFRPTDPEIFHPFRNWKRDISFFRPYVRDK